MLEFIEGLPTWIAAMPFFIVGIGGLLLVWGWKYIQAKPVPVGKQEKGFKEIWKEKGKYKNVNK
tara:strand:+ start:1578 stop:1769 length:192 start_codon:yes stop_codon:yes gene_type:complete